MSADNPTPPQGVPSDEELDRELNQFWDELGNGKERWPKLLDYVKQVRDRTLAAKDVNILDLNRIIGNRQERISELEAELNIANIAAIEWRNKVTEKILYIQHLEVELDGVHKAMQEKIDIEKRAFNIADKRITELENELKSVRANLIEAKRLITSVLTTYTEDQHRVTSDDCRMWLERHRHLPLERAADEAEKE